jgi:protein-L-isoaspartate(D-aspartate) O-methyltransferase
MSADPTALQAALLETLQASGALTDPAVAAAFRAVPRHLFLPDRPLEEVYQDEAIPTKLEEGRAISSSSQPAMMAIMLEQLGLAPGQRVLEIGAGTGYNAALMGHLVGPNGRVVTLDIDDDLVEAARQHLAAAGAENVQVVRTDGGLGYPAWAPYDRMILTVGAWDLTPAWIDQLKPGGRLVLPLDFGAGGQKSIAFEKNTAEVPPPGQPVLTSLSVRDCGFMRLRGAFAGPEQLTPLGPDPGLTFSTSNAPPVAPETVYAWLSGGAQDARTGVKVTPRDIWQGLSFWLGVSLPNVCGLIAEGDLARRGPVPCLFEFEGTRPSCVSLGGISAEGMCLLYLAPAGKLQKVVPEAPRTLWLRAFGPKGRTALAERILAELAAWDEAGRPGSADMRVRVYPAEAPVEAGPGAVAVTKRWTRLVVDWPAVTARQ